MQGKQAINMVFARLQGRWAFIRTIKIIDFNELINKAGGHASFIPLDDAALAYQETGSDAAGNEFYRHYTYRFSDRQMDVFYADGPQSGALYQSYSLTGQKLQPLADHFCGPDCYHGIYEWLDDTNFILRTLVTGPKKNFSIETQFMRLEN